MPGSGLVGGQAAFVDLSDGNLADMLLQAPVAMTADIGSKGVKVRPNDLPMLRLAGLGIAFRAKPLVRSSANQSISAMGLDGILYLIGVRDRDIGS